MSLKALEWAWQQQLPPLRKLVLLALADHADDTGVCFPGINHLSEKVGRTARTVRREIAALREHGLLRSSPRFNGPGAQTSNLFTLAVGGMTFLTAPPDITDRGGVTRLARGGDTRDSQTVIEPSGESYIRALEKYEPVSMGNGRV